jgi:hypothetical protein
MFWTVLFLVGATFLVAFPRVGAGDPSGSPPPDLSA